MATTFTVTNLNPDFEFVDGFWFDPKNDGGTDAGLDAIPGNADDVYHAPLGLTTNDARGVFVWVNGQSFDIDGDVAVATSQAYLLKNALLNRSFPWFPKNPAYNTVAPFLKDGTTANPDYDASGNPALHSDGSTPAAIVGDKCRHFSVVTA